MLNLLLIRHYPLSEGPSMRSFADQIVSGLQSRGHTVHQLTSRVVLGRLFPYSRLISKWLGYIDQFIFFPLYLFFYARFTSNADLIVLADQALGPWLFALRGLPSVVHCHDLLALEGSQGLQPFHKPSISGRLYQYIIGKGFKQARCFISVSSATRESLELQLSRKPLLSEVVYNPLPNRFSVCPEDIVISKLSKNFPYLKPYSFLFHIGRNWYKNRIGLLAIWQELINQGILYPLVLVGSLDSSLLQWLSTRQHLMPHLHILDQPSDDHILTLYRTAACLIFPSHSEGFGWPILEALACGCPVITTQRAPMTEVGGDAATYIDPLTTPSASLDEWAYSSSVTVARVLNRSPQAQQRCRERGIAHSKRFGTEIWLNQLEDYYRQAIVLQEPK
jgi:glycosyltransferase involved in cell wall biosynthesis